MLLSVARYRQFYEDIRRWHFELQCYFLCPEYKLLLHFFIHTYKKNMIIPTCKSHLTKEMQRWHLRSHSNSVFYGHGWNHCLVLHPVPLNPSLCETDSHDARDSPQPCHCICLQKWSWKWSWMVSHHSLGWSTREEVNVSVILCLFLVLTLPSVKPR